MATISACVITFNEEKNIARCLKSLSFANEIIVVDSLSTDKTVAIAKDFTPNVIQHPWIGFGPQKNYAFSLAKYDWVLTIDADEEVSPELRIEILQAMKDPKDYEVFRIPRKNYIGKHWVKYGSCFPNYPDREPRLFKNGITGCEDRLVHEGLIHAHLKACFLKEQLLHYSYPNLKEYHNSMSYFGRLKAVEMLHNEKSNLIFRIIEYLPHVIFTFFSYYLWKKAFLMGWIGIFTAFEQTRYNALKYGLTIIWRISGKKAEELKSTILLKGRC
jgi:(heptosyl)LPS beta-1,4-glucosyltransferase